MTPCPHISPHVLIHTHSVVVLAENGGPVVGLGFRLEVAIGGKLVDRAVSAVVTEAEVVPRDDLVGERLLELVVTGEDCSASRCVRLLGGDGASWVEQLDSLMSASADEGGRRREVDRNVRTTTHSNQEQD